MNRARRCRGAMVSVLGVTLASTVTDERGQFSLNQLPAGDYLLRAHMLGFAASTGAMIRVGNSTPFQRVQLRRLDGAVATTGTGEAPVKARPIIAAGFELPRGGEGTSSASSSSSEHPHDDAAWWTRHLKRSILKDSSQILVLTDDDAVPSNGSLFGRAMGSAASVASSLFTDFPFSGEVNFLTTGSVAPGALLSATALPRGVAYLALAAPGAGRRLVDPRRHERGRPVVVERRRRLRLEGDQRSAPLRPRALVQHAGVSRRQSRRAGGGQGRQPERRRAVRASTNGRSARR